MTSIFEQLGGTYTQGSDGMLYPNLSLGDREQRLIDRWGRMHRAYLETDHPCLYDRMILNGTLDRHLADVEEHAQAMLEKLTQWMALQEGITESLKAADQMEWGPQDEQHPQQSGRNRKGSDHQHPVSKGTDHGKSKTKHSLQLQSVAR